MFEQFTINKFFCETSCFRVPYTNSIIGRNVQYRCEKYMELTLTVWSIGNFSVNNINNMYFASLSDDTINTIHNGSWAYYVSKWFI